MTAEMRVPRHHRASPACKGHELVDAACFHRTRDPRHHVSADEIVLARVGGQHVHAPRAGQPADDRHRFVAADLDGIQDLVGYVGEPGLLRNRQGPAERGSDQAAAGGQSRQAQKVSSSQVGHGSSLVSILRGASPLGLPDTRSRSPRRRLAPIAWLTRYRSFADIRQPHRSVTVTSVVRRLCADCHGEVNGDPAPPRNGSDIILRDSPVASQHRNPSRPLRDPVAGWCRWDGRGVQSPRHAARSPRRRQDPEPRVCRGRAVT